MLKDSVKLQKGVGEMAIDFKVLGSRGNLLNTENNL